MTQDSALRRVTMANDDGDVYVESAGQDAEIVLKTQKVRVDGDVFHYEGEKGAERTVRIVYADGAVFH